MKQRLIDAENFPNALKEMMIEISKNRGLPKEDWFLFGFDEFVIALDVIALVRDMPTVEAIPIEWIEEWGWKNGMSESMSLRVMIDDWEKENE